MANKESQFNRSISHYHEGLAEQFQLVREGRANAFVVVYGGGFIETREEANQFARDLFHNPLNAGVTEVRVFDGNTAEVESDIRSRSGDPARIIPVSLDALDSLEKYWQLAISDIEWETASSEVKEEYSRLQREATEKLI